jgi:hypothetical protein
MWQNNFIFVQKLRVSLMPTNVAKFFRTLVLDTMATREREGIVRPDMLQLLMQAKKGTLHEDNSPGSKKISKPWQYFLSDL